MIHWDLVDDRCYRVIHRTVELLESSGSDYVIGGGWAVFSYSPRTPSIDTDVLLTEDAIKGFTAVLGREGFKIGKNEEIDLIRIDDEVGFWAYGDEDLGIPVPGFVISSVLRDRTRRRTVSIASDALDMTVPDPAALLLLKLCALHNRDLCYRSFYDGKALMELGHQRAPQVLANSQSYYHRKASKDLYDCAELAQIQGSEAPFREIVQEFQLDEVVLSMLDPIADTTKESARLLADRVGQPDPVDTLERYISGVRA